MTRRRLLTSLVVTLVVVGVGANVYAALRFKTTTPAARLTSIPAAYKDQTVHPDPKANCSPGAADATLDPNNMPAYGAQSAQQNSKDLCGAIDNAASAAAVPNP